MTYPDWRRSVPLPASVRLSWHKANPSPRDIPLSDLYASLVFPRTAGAWPYVVANMVMTQNGEATVRGKATTIGTAVDGLALTRLRSAVDAVISGSGTLLLDDVTAALPQPVAAARQACGRSPRLLAVIFASTLDWSADVFSRKFFTDRQFEKLIITGDRPRRDEIRAVESRGVEVVRVAASPSGRPDVGGGLEALTARGVHHAVCEGGPHFLPSLFAARAVHEYFLTTSPMVTGTPQVPRPISGSVAQGGNGAVLLSLHSRIEHTFRDPGTGANLIEALERFRVAYPT
jgi:riboflavin biosynthesis pyrimidine reductase